MEKSWKKVGKKLCLKIQHKKSRNISFGFNLCINQISILAPNNLANSRQIAVSPGQAGAVTRFLSTTAWSAGTSTYSPPARVISGPTAA